MHRALLVPGVSGAAVRLQSDDQAGCGCYEQGEHDARFEREEPGPASTRPDRGGLAASQPLPDNLKPSSDRRNRRDLPCPAARARSRTPQPPSMEANLLPARSMPGT